MGVKERNKWDINTGRFILAEAEKGSENQLLAKDRVSIYTPERLPFW